MNITELFKDYTDQGFLFSFYTFNGNFVIEVSMIDGAMDESGYVSLHVYTGDNVDHALSACDLWMESMQ